MHTAPTPVSIGTYNLALLVEANQVKSGVKNFISIPAVASVDFIHLATVSFDISLYDFNDLINNEATLPLCSFKILYQTIHWAYTFA